MNRFKKYCLVFILGLLGLLLSGCDLGINDIESVSGEYGNQLGLDITDIVSPKKSYEYLLEELEYMQKHSYTNIHQARKQSFKLLNIFGIADISIESSKLSTEQIEIQTDLFEEIRQINLYTNLDEKFYVPNVVRNRTEVAINLCNNFIETLNENDMG